MEQNKPREGVQIHSDERVPVILGLHVFIPLTIDFKLETLALGSFLAVDRHHLLATLQDGANGVWPCIIALGAKERTNFRILQNPGRKSSEEDPLNGQRDGGFALAVRA